MTYFLFALTNSIPHRAWRTSAQHRRLQQEAKLAAGLEPAEWSTLCYLAETRSASSDELRAQLELQPGSLTNALGTLRARGLVTTTSVKADQRARAHGLTAQGRKLAEDLARAFATALSEQDLQHR